MILGFLAEQTMLKMRVREDLPQKWITRVRRNVKQIEERSTDAAVMALNRAIDCMTEASVGLPSKAAARLLRLYADQMADTSLTIARWMSLSEDGSDFLPLQRHRLTQ